MPKPRQRMRLSLAHRSLQKRRYWLPFTARTRVVQAVVRTAVSAQIDSQAAEIAFSAVFSLGPLFSLSLMVLAAIPNEALRANLQRLLYLYAPSATHDVLQTLTERIVRPANPLVVAVSLVALVWSVSNATHAIVVALHNINRARHRGYVRSRLRAVALGMLPPFALALSAVAITLGPGVVAVLERVLHLRHVALDIWSQPWVRWPAAGLSYTLVAALFYAYGTMHRPRRRALFAGALFAGLSAGAASTGLSVYLTFVPRLGGGYGAATSFLGVLLWLYLLAFTLLLGAVVTHVLDRRLRAA